MIGHACKENVLLASAPGQIIAAWVFYSLTPCGGTYNLGNLWRRLVLQKKIENWSLTSLQQRLAKTGGRQLLILRSAGSGCFFCGSRLLAPLNFIFLLDIL